MSCPSGIFTNNTNYVAGPDATIPFGTIVRRFGRNVNLDGSSIVCCGSGYYKANVSVTLTPEAAGTIGVALLADGAQVAYAQGTGAAGTPLNLSLTAYVRQRCCGATSLSLQLLTEADVTTGATVNACPCTVEKI